MRRASAPRIRRRPAAEEVEVAAEAGPEAVQVAEAPAEAEREEAEREEAEREEEAAPAS